MGWDAYSSAEYNWEKNQFKDKAIGKLFNQADKEIREKTGNVDWGFDKGLLDTSDCANMLEKATGKSCYDKPYRWSAKQVKQYNQSANWDFEFELGDAWAYWSAKKFLEICAGNNLSIRFSY